ncbi:DUF4190 domain-containing protein [Actinomadura sp. BRA 177]|uniref:DUF4190 domain-containing protein n=1 Tax=Actinomadura sp. BRA 177 TaxID=2745202 RepID=UPI001595BF3B|nr:DUF4190 domain-containing protein [Actinomadura sp. BRA 177]NVI87581.1 septum formation family protein [Actinomadura sp. BRA 177]
MTLPPDTDDVPATPPPARTNRFAITALITGLLGLVLFAIAFAVTALVQTGRRSEKGRGLAVTALALSIAWLAAGAALLIATGRDEHAPAREADGPRASVLAVGDCFAGFRQAGAKIFARAAPCATAHEGEVIGKPDLPILEYPGDARLAAEGEKACRVQASSLYAARRGDEFVLSIDRPDKRAWDHGEHAVTCLIRYSDGPENVRLEELPKSQSQLVAGDCVGTWSESGYVYLVDCAKKHEVQVFARVTRKVRSTRVRQSPTPYAPTRRDGSSALTRRSIS